MVHEIKVKYFSMVEFLIEYQKVSPIVGLKESLLAMILCAAKINSVKEMKVGDCVDDGGDGGWWW